MIQKFLLDTSKVYVLKMTIIKAVYTPTLGIGWAGTWEKEGLCQQTTESDAQCPGCRSICQMTVHLLSWLSERERQRSRTLVV